MPENRFQALFVADAGELFLLRAAAGIEQHVDVQRGAQRRRQAHRLIAAIDRLLGHADRARGGSGHRCCERLCRRDHLVRRYHSVDDPQPQSVRSGHLIVAGQQQLLRRLRPGDPGQQHGDNAGAKAHLRLAELGALRRYGNVAGQRQFERASQAVAMHRGDGRLRRVPELHDEVELQAHLHLPILHILHLALGRGFQIEASRKRPALTADDNNLDRIVGIQFANGSQRFVHQIVVEGIQDARAVKGDGADRAVTRHQDMVIGHGADLLAEGWVTKPKPSTQGAFPDRLKPARLGPGISLRRSSSPATAC